jgi:17beta-estradiol 17-dehydrogenase / very-long-chain 3-oxoacyl-CoA reductase
LSQLVSAAAAMFLVPTQSVLTEQMVFTLGTLTALRLLYAWLLRPLVVDLLWRRSIDFRDCGGEWAVVTGATDGIGKAMAIELARRGMSIVLVSRTQSRLDAAAAEVRAANAEVHTRTVEIDFTETHKGIFARLGEALEGLKVGVLVNNVGVSYPHAQYLVEVDDARLDALSTVNVQSMLRVTKTVLDGDHMSAGGAIVNVSSAAGLLSSDPLYAGYAGTKAFVDAFSRSLAVELAAKRIAVQCHAPLFVATKLAKIRRPSFFVPDPADYARAAVNAFAFGGDVTVVPYWPHRAQHFLVGLCPVGLWAFFKLRFGLGIRRRAMAKAAKRS